MKAGFCRQKASVSDCIFSHSLPHAFSLSCSLCSASTVEPLSPPPHHSLHLLLMHRMHVAWAAKEPCCKTK